MQEQSVITITSGQARDFATRLAITLHHLDLHDWRNADVRRALFNAAEACAQAADAMERSR